MIVEVKRVVKKEIEETTEMELSRKWCINLVRGTSNTELKVFKRIELDHEPSAQEIADALCGSVQGNVRASVIEFYELDNIKEDK